MHSVDVVMHPPEDCSDEESGEEQETEMHHLPRSQLIADADVELIYSSDEEDPPPVQRGEKKIDMKWKKGDLVAVAFDCSVFLRHNFPEALSEPVDFFNLLFSDEIIQYIVDETNSYAAIEVTVNELKATLGVLLASGIAPVNKRRQYWSNNLVTKNFAIVDAISKNRFDSIFSKLHFQSTKNANDSGDKFWKLRPLLDYFNENFMKFGLDSSTYSVDEAMIPYFGRHGCKQFIRGKPVRFGFKCWVLANPGGYVYSVQPYPGVAEKPTNSVDLGASSNVVYYYGSILHNMFPSKSTVNILARIKYYIWNKHIILLSGISITCDNYFTSPSLLMALKKNFGIHATGTQRTNRIPNSPVPEKKTMDKEPRGSTMSW